MRIGIDLGGTKIETAVLDTEGNIVYRHRVETPSESYPYLIEVIHQEIFRCESSLNHQFSRAGLCIPGTLETPESNIKNANLQILNGKRFGQDLARATEKEIRLVNDANSLIWSEYVDGVASDSSCCFGVILGTGVGGGVVANGKMVTGSNGIGGEWGHNPLPDYDPEKDGPELPCYCGRNRCIETFLSGTGFARRYNHQHGCDLSAKSIASLAREGCSGACDHLARYADQLARSLGSVINVLDPDVIVLGGGMSNIDSLYEQVPLRWKKYLFMTSGHVNTRLVKARHGDSSGVRGAAWL